MKIITIHSRKGGVGKTTIALSSALQVAAAGKKVALIEVDTQGCGLNQLLRLKGDWSSDLKTISEKYLDVKRINDYLSDRRIEWSDVMTPLASRCQDVQKLSSQLFIGSLSCAVSDLEQVNDRSVMTNSGRRELHLRLSDLEEALKQDGFDVAIFDHTQGLSFAPGVMLSWALNRAADNNNEDEVNVWFVSGPSWVDAALLLYEINVYAEFLKPVHPVLIVNRARKDWRGNDDGALVVKRGEAINLKDHPNRNGIARRFFSIPLWLQSGSFGTDESMWRNVVEPIGLTLVLLSYYANSDLAQIAPQDQDRAGQLSTQESDDALSQLISNLHNFEESFIQPAIKGDDDLHANIRTALVEPLLSSGQPR